MTAVKVLPSGESFDATPEGTLFDAFVAAGVAVQHGCGRGSCGQCRAKLVRGKVATRGEGRTLEAGDEILLCCSRAVSDVELELRQSEELAGLTIRNLPCRLSKIERLGVDTIRLTVRIPPGEVFEFIPGQYVDVLRNGIRRSYSIASFDPIANVFEFHIRRVPGGAFTSYLFEQAETSDLCRLEGPFGSFFVRPSRKPLIFLAGGTGFAPVQAIVEGLLRQNADRKIYVYWGNTTADGFYTDRGELWAARHDQVNYVPVLSSGAWNGRMGDVHLAVLEDFPSLKDFEVYACGSPRMIDVARQSFVNKGLEAEAFFADSFA